MSGNICPSYKAGFYAPRRGGVPKYPGLWKGCVGAWNPGLGPTGATLRDSSGNNNHGTLTNMGASTDWEPKLGNYTLGCLGSNDVVICNRTYGFTSSSSFSLCGWIIPDVFLLGSIFNTVIAQRATAASYEWALRVGASGTVSFLSTAGGSVNGTTVMSLGNLYHLAAVFVAGAVTVYLNGKSEGSGTSRTITNVGTVASIGGWANADSNGAARSYLDDIFIHSPALTESQIRMLSSRRGIAHETTRRRSYKAAAAGFRPAWASQRTQIIGGGSR